MNEQELQRQNALKNQAQNNARRNQAQSALSAQISSNRVTFPKALKFIVDGQ